MKTYVWQRAAAPFLGLLHEAAGGVPGAAGVAVTHDFGRLSWTENSTTGLLQQGWDLLQPGQTEAPGPVTGLSGHVAFVPFWAAVLMIVTAHGLENQDPSARQVTGAPTEERHVGLNHSVSVLLINVVKTHVAALQLSAAVLFPLYSVTLCALT